MCVYVLDYIFLHLNSRKERKKLSGQRHNLWNTKHTHTRARTRIHTRILSRILTKRFRWVGLFVKFVLSRSRVAVVVVVIVNCFRRLLCVFARAICSCTANKVGRVFGVASFFGPSSSSSLHKSNGIFFLCFVLAPRLVSAYLFYKFSTHTHTCTRIYTYLLLSIKCCCCCACKTKRFLINVLQPMWERDGDSLCFLYSQSFSLSYTNCGRINMLDRCTKSKKHPGTVSLLSLGDPTISNNQCVHTFKLEYVCNYMKFSFFLSEIKMFSQPMKRFLLLHILSYSPHKTYTSTHIHTHKRVRMHISSSVARIRFIKNVYAFSNERTKEGGWEKGGRRNRYDYEQNKRTRTVRFSVCFCCLVAKSVNEAHTRTSKSKCVSVCVRNCTVGRNRKFSIFSSFGESNKWVAPHTHTHTHT